MKRLIISVLVLVLVKTIFSQVLFGDAHKLNNGWKFSLSDQVEAKNNNFDDNNWETVEVPHDWTVKGQLSPALASCTGYLPGGIALYRKSLTIDANKKDKKIYLYFEGIYNRSEVYINGKLLGKRPNGYISFMYDTTPYIQFAKENIIAVRVDHSLYADSRWYSGSGIYRDAWVVYANPVHIAQWGVYAVSKNVSAKQATLAVEVELVNSSKAPSKLTVQNSLVSPEGVIVAQSSSKINILAAQNGKINVALKLKNPQLWDLQNPNLYTLNTKVIENGKIIDESSVKTGIRSYTFDPNKGFALNGKWLKMKGVCLHHDAGVLGAATYKEVWRHRLINLKEIGVNAIRTSHNPQASHLYELCDELGFLVMNEAFDEWEFPKRKWLTGWNHGTPGFQGTYDFFEEWGESDLRDMILRDRNHVSIFAYSIGNEVDYPNDPYSHPVLDGGRETGFTQPIFGGYKRDAPDAMRLGVIAKRLAGVVRKYDPSRLVTGGLAGVAMSNETEYPGALDIAGYNYTENRYETDHIKYPNRVIYGSENRHDLNAWKHVRDKEYIFGQFLWTGIDYLGESGQWPTRGFYSGLLDLGGFIKPRGYFRKSLWSDKPMAYIGTYPNGDEEMKDVWSQHENKNKKKIDEIPSMDAWPVWNYEVGQSIRVVVYSNAPTAKLLLNTKEVGATKEYNDNTGIYFWDIPYEAGKLEVVGMDKSSNEIVRHSIQTSGRPYALVVKNKDIAVAKNGIALVEIEVVDENGLKVQLADNEITCHISGDAKLLGLEGSDNTDMGNYTDNKQRAYQGRLLAYIKANENSQEIKVKFLAPLLKSEEMNIVVMH
jgi:beta-galactosidase